MQTQTQGAQPPALRARLGGLTMQPRTYNKLADMYPERDPLHLAAYIRLIGIEPDGLDDKALAALAKVADERMAAAGDLAKLEARALAASQALGKPVAADVLAVLGL